MEKSVFCGASISKYLGFNALHSSTSDYGKYFWFKYLNKICRNTFKYTKLTPRSIKRSDSLVWKIEIKKMFIANSSASIFVFSKILICKTNYLQLYENGSSHKLL